MKFSLEKGDITTYDVDAIINAANISLLGGGGVDGAIHYAAGPKLLAECRTLGGCKPGEAKITKGYNLPAKYVIHTVGPVWRGGTNGEKELLKKCYINSLELAKKYGLTTIAFPLVSSGVFGYPIKEALYVAIKTIFNYNESNMKIILVLYDDSTYKMALSIYNSVLDVDID